MFVSVPLARMMLLIILAYRLTVIRYRYYYGERHAVEPHLELLLPLSAR